MGDVAPRLAWNIRQTVPANSAMKQEEWLIAYIDAAFDGVKLEDGKDIYQAQSDDGYGNADELALSVVAERENWRKIPREDLHSRFWGIGYLDPKGLRFYAPAIMSLILTERLTSKMPKSPLVDWFLQSFRLHRFQNVRGSLYRQLFNNKQRSALLRFFKYIAFNFYQCGLVDLARDRVIELQKDDE